MKDRKLYWKGTEQLTNDPEFVKYAEKEFPEYLPINESRKDSQSSSKGSSRRDFLKIMGFSVAAATVAACEAPVRKSIPYLNKPVEVDPGIANYYASTYINGGNYCSVLVKTREGRPIKIEANKLSTVSKGGTNAQVQASVLSLYDKERLTGPYIAKENVDWATLDNQIKTKLASIASGNGQIRIVTRSILSPSTKAAIAQFINKYPTTKIVTYDPVSSYALLRANEMMFGVKSLPKLHFDKVQTVVSFDADFLGTWINPISFSADFIKTRKVNAEHREMSRLYVFESNLSLTGANADIRVPVKPSSQGLHIGLLYNAIAKATGNATLDLPSPSNGEGVEKAAADLLKSKGKSLVVSGINDVNIQLMVNGINKMLDNYENTIDIKNPVYYRQGDDVEMAQLVKDLNNSTIDGVIFFDCNPVYEHPLGQQLASGITKTKLSVSTSDRRDETANLTGYIAPDRHFLESWNDAEPEAGKYSLSQPTISNLFDSRQKQDSLLQWSSATGTYYDLIRQYWKQNIYNQQADALSFDVFWDKCLHDGIYESKGGYSEEYTLFNEVNIDVAAIKSRYKADSEDVELVIYESVAIGDGSQANNPWLQETPDPISKACWQNYITVSQSWANEHGLKMVESNTYFLDVTIDGTVFSIPAMVQPGQARGTVGLALGYGRSSAGKVANGVGINAYPFVSVLDGVTNLYSASKVEIVISPEATQIPQTQTHHTFMNRNYVVQEATLDEYKKDAFAGRHIPKIAASQHLESVLGDKEIDGKLKPSKISLWKGHDYTNHHWGMSIDMNSCIGCAACSVSCQAENNVPVVGPQEVLNRREMAWIRIDRYYSSTTEDLEVAAENPEVTFQPMMCQQCNNAPCETVCPVAATTHSTEGLNQMTYNRCIGTRYCANNCPYKVRRFNWFKYHDNNKAFPDNTSMNNDLGKMVLNPDVTVRSRGVMEKCSFCVQRIQAGKLEAKKEGRRPVDGEIEVACANACPTDAIVFGDLRDPESKISKLLKLEDYGKEQEIKEERAYHVLEDINVLPNVWYLSKIRNKDEKHS